MRNRIVILVPMILAGCQKNAPAPNAPAAVVPAPVAVAKPQPYRTYVSSNVLAYLRPRDPKNPTDEDAARKLWQTMMPSMAADPESVKLMQRLHGGLATKLEFVEAPQNKDEKVMTASPPTGSEVVVRLADQIVADEKIGFTGKRAPARSSLFSQVVLIENAATKSIGKLESAPMAMTNVFQELPPHETIFLAMEDYVLRHSPNWVLVQQVTGDDPALPSAEEQRHDLDQRINRYAERAKAYYDTLRPRN